MVGTRQLAQLLDHAQRRQVKVVLVGDPHQLPEIDAGGLFSALATRLPSVELTANRRQRQEWEVDALAQLRHGDIDHALDAYRDHGRVVTASDADALRERLVGDWWDTVDRLGSTSTIMVALRRTDVADLNARARARLAAADRLTGPTIDTPGGPLQAGDRIVCLKNDPRLGVVNGTRATITAIDPESRAIRATGDDGDTLVLPAQYLDDGHVTHGYAITGHKAQGLTVDHTFVLGSDALYREWGYVAMSRGRHTNRLYLHPNLDGELDRHGLQPDPEPIAALPHRLTRTRAERPVSTDPAARWRQLHTWLTDPDIHHLRELAARREQLTADIERLTAAVTDGQAGLTALGRGLGRPGRRAAREQATRYLERQRTKLTFLQRELAQVDAELEPLPDPETITAAKREHGQLTRQLTDLAHQHTDVHHHAPPRYLLATLGTPPDDPHGRRRWREAAQAIELYRLRWDITDPDLPIGDEPTDGIARDDHQRLTADLTRHRHELTAARDQTLGHSRGLGR